MISPQANDARPILTIAAAWKFWNQFAPLSKSIALRAIDRDRRYSSASQTVDEDREETQQYGHPSMTAKLELPWTPWGPLDPEML